MAYLMFAKIVIIALLLPYVQIGIWLRLVYIVKRCIVSVAKNLNQIPYFPFYSFLLHLVSTLWRCSPRSEAFSLYFTFKQFFGVL